MQLERTFQPFVISPQAYSRIRLYEDLDDEIAVLMAAFDSLQEAG